MHTRLTRPALSRAKASGLLDRIIPVPEGQRMVAMGLNAPYLPMHERVQMVQEGRRRLADEEHPFAVRREALEGFRSGAFLGGSGALLTGALSRGIHGAAEIADERRLRLLADQVFSSLTLPGGIAGPDIPARSNGQVDPLELRQLLLQEQALDPDVSARVLNRLESLTGVRYVPRSTANAGPGQRAFFNMIADPAVDPEKIRAQANAAFPGFQRAGTLDKDDIHAIVAGPLRGVGGNNENAGGLVRLLLEDPELAPAPGTIAEHAAEAADTLTSRGILTGAENALRGPLQRAADWLATPLTPGLARLPQRVTGAVAGEAPGIGRSMLSLLAGRTAATLTSRGAGVAMGVGALAAAAAALRQRSNRDDLLARATQPEDMTAQELLGHDRSTATALAATLNPERPLQVAGKTVRDVRVPREELAQLFASVTAANAGIAPNLM